VEFVKENLSHFINNEPTEINSQMLINHKLLQIIYFRYIYMIY